MWFGVYSKQRLDNPALAVANETYKDTCLKFSVSCVYLIISRRTMEADRPRGEEAVRQRVPPAVPVQQCQHAQT